MIDPARSVVPFQAAARELGLHPATLRRMCAKGDGPRLLRLSERRLGIRRRDLDAWVASREVPAQRNPIPANDASAEQDRGRGAS